MRTCGDAFVKEGKARAGSPILNMEEHLPYRLHQSTKSTAESHYIRAGKASAVSPILDQEEHLWCRLYQSRKSTCGIAYIRAGRAPVVSPILEQEEHLRCRLYQSRKSTCGIAYIRSGRASCGTLQVQQLWILLFTQKRGLDGTVWWTTKQRNLLMCDCSFKGTVARDFF